MDSVINLAVAGLMIPSTSAKKTGAFPSECPEIPMQRRKVRKLRATIYLFKILTP
jgi:hypothetical protein